MNFATIGSSRWRPARPQAGALEEAQLNLGGDFSKLGKYVQVTSSGRDATLSLTPAAQVGSSGASLAVLHGVGSGVTLNMLISDHALLIS